MTLLYILLGLCVFATVLLIFFVYHHIQREAMAIRERIVAYSPRAVRATVEAAIAKRRTREQVAAQFAQNARAFRAKWGIKDSPDTRRMLLMAGLANPIFLELYIASRIALAGITCAIVLIFTHQIIPVVGLTVGGYIAPEYLIQHLVNRRLRNIRRAMPDLCDLLQICIDAGLGIDQSIKRVSDDLQPVFPALYDELQVVLRRQNLGVPRIEAWREFNARVDCEEVRGFVSMLEQTEKFGTPISRALNTYGEMIRLTRQQNAEKRAAKVPVKMLFPLVLCIFPCIFVVLLGPPIIEFMTSNFTLSTLNQPAVVQPHKESHPCHQPQFVTYPSQSSSSCLAYSSCAAVPEPRQEHDVNA